MGATAVTFTERYVTNSGAGDGAGTSWANAMAWDSIGTNATTAGLRFNISGTIHPTSLITLSTLGTYTAPIMLRGWNDAQTQVSSTWDDTPFIDCSTLGSGHVIDVNNDYYVFQGLRFANAPGVCIFNNSAAYDWHWYYLVSCQDGADTGFYDWGQYTYYYKCKSFGNTGHGFYHGSNGSHLVHCEAYDNGSHNYSGGLLTAYIHCFSGNQGNGYAGFNTAHGSTYYGCTADSGTAASNIGISCGNYCNIFNSITTGGSYEIYGSSTSGFYFNNLLDGAANDSNNTYFYMIENEITGTAPGYTDIDNQDYSLTNTDLYTAGDVTPMPGTPGLGAYVEGYVEGTSGAGSTLYHGPVLRGVG